MATNDKSGLAAAILAKSSPKTEEDTDEDVDDTGLESAMEDFMAALKDQDLEAAVSAYKALKELS